MQMSASSNWQTVPKKYFHLEPEKNCFIEQDPQREGSPLWPLDPSFDSSIIDANIAKAGKSIAKQGGKIFSGHLLLQPDRSLSAEKELFQPNPIRLQTTFVTASLLPKNKIAESRTGFYVKEGSTPPLSQLAKNLEGTWLMSNLGHFITKKLIALHNSRHPNEEQLQETDNNYLGGFFVQNGKKFVGYPPHLETAGVAVTKEGAPRLITQMKLKGGTIRLGDFSARWEEADVNPHHPDKRPVILYTPTFQEKTGQDWVHDPWKAFKQTIGKDRFNIIIINEGTGDHPRPMVAYTVAGECLQPAGAIVVSLAKKPEQTIDRTTPVEFSFDPWFDSKLWKETKVFYEGLIPLPIHTLEDFGPWVHPHARLTQETQIANPQRREPRTALIETENYFGTFAFSGRYELSIGISYLEMSRLIPVMVKKMFPSETLRTAVGLDGGSAAKMCWIENGKVAPLNWVAPGLRNRMGDPEGNTYSCLFLKIPS